MSGWSQSPYLLATAKLTSMEPDLWYDTVYLTCSKKLTCSQLSPPQGTNRKIKEKNKLKINREAWYTQWHEHKCYEIQQKPRQPVPVGPNINMLLLSSLSSNDVESRMSLAWRCVSSLPPLVLRCSTALLGPSGLLPPGVCSVVMPAMCSSSAHNQLREHQQPQHATILKAICLFYRS